MQLKIEDVKNVLILGSGTLGLRIGLQSALSGFDTTIYDIHEKALQSAEKIQEKILNGLIKEEKISQQAADAAKSRISFTSDIQSAAPQADFVSESIIEDVELKKKAWAGWAPLWKKEAVLTTNTSYLLPSMFAQESGMPERFCAFHFHDVFWANVVDIMPHPGTEAWIIGFLREMGLKLNQTPVVVSKESPGYIFNAMLMAFIGAAGALLTGQVASIEDIDRSWMGNFKMPTGPFGIIDSVGLDTAWHVTRGMKDSKSQRFAELLKNYIDQGKLGVKTGEGFYKYPDPAFSQEGFVKGV
ncbi:MAG: 3-hydroxyacyl-CoA dehydrogenase NAD-binding domain-containing protein [bacterium]